MVIKWKDVEDGFHTPDGYTTVNHGVIQRYLIISLMAAVNLFIKEMMIMKNLLFWPSFTFASVKGLHLYENWVSNPLPAF